MNQERDIAKFFLEGVEHLCDLLVVGGITWKGERSIQSICQALHTFLETISLVSQGDASSGPRKSLSNAPRDAAFISYAKNDSFSARQVDGKHLTTSLSSYFNNIFLDHSWYYVKNEATFSRKISNCLSGSKLANRIMTVSAPASSYCTIRSLTRSAHPKGPQRVPQISEP